MTQDNWSPSFEPPVGGTPLQDFEGKFAGFSRRENKGTDSNTGREWTSVFVELKYTDVVVHKSTEPYPWPTATITIPYSDPSRSYGKDRWSVFTSSARRIMGKAPVMNELVGKSMRMTLVESTIRARNQETSKYEDTETDCWQITHIAGVQQKSADEILTELAKSATGKTDQQFYTELLQKPEVTSNIELVTAITESKLVENMVALGKVTREPDGTLKAV